MAWTSLAEFSRRFLIGRSTLVQEEGTPSQARENRSEVFAANVAIGLSKNLMDRPQDDRLPDDTGKRL
jgi:hypothetical protein